MTEFYPQRTFPKESSRTRAVAIWLMIGVGMLIIQILLGGVTRLTGSGLSITEWNVITGRSEEHMSELQSPYDLVCRLLLEIGRASCRERV